MNPTEMPPSFIVPNLVKFTKHIFAPGAQITAKNWPAIIALGISIRTYFDLELRSEVWLLRNGVVPGLIPLTFGHTRPPWRNGSSQSTLTNRSHQWIAATTAFTVLRKVQGRAAVCRIRMPGHYHRPICFSATGKHFFLITWVCNQFAAPLFL